MLANSSSTSAGHSAEELGRYVSSFNPFGRQPPRGNASGVASLGHAPRPAMRTAVVTWSCGTLRQPEYAGARVSGDAVITRKERNMTIHKGVSSLHRRVVSPCVVVLVMSAAALPFAAVAAMAARPTTAHRRARRNELPGELSDAVRVRLGPETLDRLDRVVAFAQGQGRREVTRSYLIRDALDAYLAEVEKKFPEITRTAVTSAWSPLSSEPPKR